MRRPALALMLISAFIRPCPAADRLDEVRRAFTIDGKPIPPRIFADFGEATLPDSRPITVTLLPIIRTMLITVQSCSIESKRDNGTEKGAQLLENAPCRDFRRAPP